MGLSLEAYKKIFVDDSKLLGEEAFTKIVGNSQQTHQSLEQLLIDQSFISSGQFLELLGRFFGTPTTDLKPGSIKPTVVKLLKESFATKNLLIAFEQDDKTLKVAFTDPSQSTIIDEIEAATNLIVQPYVAREIAVKRALVLYDGTIDEVVQNMLRSTADATAPDANGHAEGLATAVLEAALLLEASDVHLEPFETEFLVRFRVDGTLRTIASLPTQLHSGLTTALKIAGQLKIDQKRLPQDGRFSSSIKGQEVNVRMSTVPSLWGEKIVLRMLPKEAHQLDLNGLGLSEADLTVIRSYIMRPYGLILVCGPTGSGKSSSLYACLQEIGRDRVDVVNISTIEDPIEYTIPRVTQIQTQPEIDLTFANGLRALLRQDPDIIMVGEIRDQETAEFSIRASLVGRLVLSSIHTNDAVGAIPRLLDMGMEPYLVSSTLCLVVAQRLARKLCTACRESYKPTADVLSELQTNHKLSDVLKGLEKQGVITNAKRTEELRFYKSVGCNQCSNTGYRGRMGVFELLEITDPLRVNINNREDTATLKATALKQGMKSMFQDGMSKVLLGHIDLPELLRVVYA